MTTFAELVTAWVTPLESSPLRYSLSFSYMLREMAALEILLADSLSENAKTPYELVGVIDGDFTLENIGFSTHFNEFVTWLLDQDADMDAIMEKGKQWYLEKWNE